MARHSIEKPLAIAALEPFDQLGRGAPEPPGYRVAESRSIPLEIAPDPEAPEAPSTRSSEASDPERETQPKAAPTRIWVLALALLVALATGLWWLRRRARSEADPSAERARGAAAAFRAGLERGGTDPGEVYAAYLAARLNCAPAAVISPDLARVLVGRGASADLAARAARALDELVAARYGGRSRVERHALAALVDELDPVFDERPRR